MRYSGVYFGDDGDVPTGGTYPVPLGPVAPAPMLSNPVVWLGLAAVIIILIKGANR